MREFDWSLIRSFLAALESGSLAAASRVTGISQPTLGRHIDELEQALGVTLFHRGRNGMTPTPTALKVSDAARDMRAARNALSMAATDSSHSISGTVRITASEIVATYFLPEILADLLHDLPAVEIELVPNNAIENLLQRDADLAIRMVRPTQNDLIARQINVIEMGIYAHRDYLNHHGRPTGFDDLKDHVVIGYDRNDLIIKGFAEAGYTVDRSFFRFRCDDQVAALEALVAGVGVGFAPRAIARRHDSLEPLIPEIVIPGLPMWLTSHRELRTSASIRAVNDYLAEKLGALALS